MWLAARRLHELDIRINCIPIVLRITRILFFIRLAANAIGDGTFDSTQTEVSCVKRRFRVFIKRLSNANQHRNHGLIGVGITRQHINDFLPYANKRTIIPAFFGSQSFLKNIRTIRHALLLLKFRFFQPILLARQFVFSECPDAIARLWEGFSHYTPFTPEPENLWD